MTTFALVHGAYHNRHCWDLVVRELTVRGHRGIAMDLPSADPDAGIEDYASAVIDAIGDVRDDLVVVGHSLGGLTIPLVAARVPVQRLIFVAAFALEPGTTIGDVLSANPGAINPALASAGVDNGDGTASMPVETALELFYEDCPRDIAEWAVGLLRPQGWKASSEPLPLESWPPVPMTYIACQGDRTLTIDFQRTIAKTHGMDLVELPGSHSPFLSRPSDLVDILTSL
jgi:pimeloyl-ACP methyl ester carboxylesterase